MIYVESKRKSLATIEKLYPGAVIIDVTSRGEEPWVKVSPFYPHGDIPVPFSEGVYAASVEGVWQGLKVFEQEDVDFSKFENDSMKGIKRTVRKLGKPLGHRKGVDGTELLDYATARRHIYGRTYGWMLDHKAQEVIERLVAQAEQSDLVLLDYDTNGDFDNLKTPLSHAALVKRYIEKKHPHLTQKTFSPKPAPETLPTSHTQATVEPTLKTGKSRKSPAKPGSSKKKSTTSKQKLDNEGQLRLL